MLAIINERQLTEEQAIQLELEEMAPEKFDAELQFKVNKEHSNVKKETRYRTLTREECAKLIAASNAPFETPPPAPAKEYPTYSREQVEVFMREHFKYKDAKEGDKWDSQKTTELDTKTDTKPKRSKSTKA